MVEHIIIGALIVMLFVVFFIGCFVGALWVCTAFMKQLEEKNKCPVCNRNTDEQRPD